jgi:hypothetical protein
MKGCNMKLALLSIFLALPLIGAGQTAKVIPLSAEDTTRIVKAQAAVDAAQKALQAVQDEIRVKYTETTDRAKGGDKATSGTLTGLSSTRANCWSNVTSSGVSEIAGCQTPPKPAPVRYYLRGWEYGVEYSEDFRFIVPVKAPAYTQASGTSCSPSWIMPTGSLTVQNPVGTTGLNYAPVGTQWVPGALVPSQIYLEHQ